MSDGIIQKVDHVQMKDYVGSFGHLGATFDKKAAEEMATRPWVPEPSPAQVRAMVTEFCVLPLGSQGVKDHAPLNTYINKKGNRAPKNGTPVLLCGSPGTGKKMLVHAVAHETGANLFNLTPSNTEGKYPGKKAYDMVHTVLKVAKARPKKGASTDAGLFDICCLRRILMRFGMSFSRMLAPSCGLCLWVCKCV